MLCQRCARTICGECQTPAPVGVICPECIRVARPTGPGVVTIVRRRTSRFFANSGVTYSIIAVTIVVYFLQVIPGITVGFRSFTDLFAFAGVFVEPNEFEPWRAFTMVLVHSPTSWLHIAFNMYLLFLVGRNVEHLLGPLRYLFLYLISALGGAVGVVWLASPIIGVVGASGAILGLAAALFVINRRLGGTDYQMLILLALNLVLGFIPGTSISWQAHLGGVVAGLLGGLIFVETRKRSQGRIQWWLLVVLTAVLIVLLLRYFYLPGQ